MTKLIIAGVVLLIGFAFLPGIKTTLSSLYNMTNSTYNLTPFEQTVWQFMPLILLVAIIFGAIWVFVGKKFGDRNEE